MCFKGGGFGFALYQGYDPEILVGTPSKVAAGFNTFQIPSDSTSYGINAYTTDLVKKEPGMILIFDYEKYTAYDTDTFSSYDFNGDGIPDFGRHTSFQMNVLMGDFSVQQYFTYDLDPSDPNIKDKYWTP